MANDDKNNAAPGAGWGIVALLRALGAWILSARSKAKAKLTNPDVKFEESDVSARGVVLVGAGVLVFALLATVFLHPLFEYFVHLKAKQSPPPLPEFSHGVVLPPEPRLQPSPRRDLEETRLKAELELNSYSVLDREQGTVTIPIERAMDLLVQRGIPPQKTPPPNMFYEPRAGTRLTGFEGKVEPKPR